MKESRYPVSNNVILVKKKKQGIEEIQIYKISSINAFNCLLFTEI